MSCYFQKYTVPTISLATRLQIDGDTYGHKIRECKYVIVEVIILPEHITSSLAVELPESLVPHSLSEDSDPTQDDEIHHVPTRSCVETEVLSVETAEPQSSCLHTTDDDFWFQSDQPSTGLHSPWCCISNMPIQLLVPPTNLTLSDSVQTRK